MSRTPRNGWCLRARLLQPRQPFDFRLTVPVWRGPAPSLPSGYHHHDATPMSTANPYPSSSRGSGLWVT